MFSRIPGSWSGTPRMIPGSCLEFRLGTLGINAEEKEVVRF